MDLVIDQETQQPVQTSVFGVSAYVSGENVPDRTGYDPHPVPLPLRERGLAIVQLSDIDDMLNLFAQWMRLDVADGAGSQSTIKAYWSDTRDHLVWLAGQGLRPAEVDEDLLKEYRATLVARYKVSTAGRKFVSVRRFYDMAHARGMLPSNPAARIKSPADRTEEHERIKFLSRLQLQRLMALTDEQFYSGADKVKALRDRAMLLLMGRHGLRVIEVARLNMAGLNFQADGEGSTLRVFGKRSKWRTIHLVPQTQAAIEKWLAARELIRVQDDAEGSPVFVSMHWADNGHGVGGQRLGTRGIRYMIDELLIKADAKREGISCHTLRHSFGTWAVFDGADLRAVSQEMGHGDINTTTKYSKVVDAMKSNPAKYMTFMEMPLSADEMESLHKKSKKVVSGSENSTLSGSHKKGTGKENSNVQ